MELLLTEEIVPLGLMSVIKSALSVIFLAVSTTSKISFIFIEAAAAMSEPICQNLGKINQCFCSSSKV